MLDSKLKGSLTIFFIRSDEQVPAAAFYEILGSGTKGGKS
jgi:hypothetical protein